MFVRVQAASPSVPRVMKIKLLMLAKDRSALGGVVNFVNMLERNLSKGIDVEEFRIGQRKNRTGRLFRWLVPFVDMVRLAFRVILNRYDVVHINPSLNGRSLFRDALFMLVMKVRGIRNIVLFMHGWEAEAEKTIDNSALLKSLFRTFFGGAPVIYVLAGQFRQSLIDWGFVADRIHVTTTMFDGRLFDHVSRNRDGKEIRLLYLSRFVKEKGVYELLTAFGRMSEDFPGLRLIFAGEGAEYDGMRNWVSNAGLQDVVSFAGYVRYRNKAQILVDSDIFVFPTYYGEGCPVSLLEAMAAGLPLVTTTAGGIGDFFVHGRNGIVLDKVSADKVEAALRELLANHAERTAMGEYNKKIAWERYEAAVVSGNIEKTYRSLVPAD